MLTLLWTIIKFVKYSYLKYTIAKIIIMKRCLLILFTIIPLLGQAQEQFLLSIDEYQVVEDSNTLVNSQFRFPINDMVLIMGGLNDLDGLGNYFNVYGNKLLVEQMSISFNGVHAITLRREDGQNFYNLFPTLKAKLIPLTNTKESVLLNQ